MTQPRSNHPRNDALGRDRFEVQVLVRPGASTLADDVMTGLQQRPKTLPPKHFYDDVGSVLFDRICETPEYYQTRTELALLQQVAPRLIDSLSPTAASIT